MSVARTGLPLLPVSRASDVALPTCAGYRPVIYLRPAWVAVRTRCDACLTIVPQTRVAPRHSPADPAARCQPHVRSGLPAALSHTSAAELRRAAFGSCNRAAAGQTAACLRPGNRPSRRLTVPSTFPRRLIGRTPVLVRTIEVRILTREQSAHLVIAPLRTIISPSDRTHCRGRPAFDLPVQRKRSANADDQAAVIVLTGVLPDRLRIVPLQRWLPELPSGQTSHLLPELAERPPHPRSRGCGRGR